MTTVAILLEPTSHRSIIEAIQTSDSVVQNAQYGLLQDESPDKDVGGYQHFSPG